MTGTGPLIRPMTPADRPALANFPNRVLAGSSIFRFHGSVTVLTDKTLNLLLDLVDGQREAITAVDDRGDRRAWPASRATTWTSPPPRLRSWWPTNGNIAALRASSSTSRGEGSKRGNRTVSRRD